ncbi:hypothetical protein OF376_00195 [Ureaplasma miroungigenitalium]|uniref:DivIVA domain-containing protein n=1 Tax=Ureaplasma miroungigenitalium TaxID=1042321 RepID=A0ABT3BLT0_9BACT|nr:hypothetical protein [Ureaplasma miroungigenitalium]MCV3728210.1 hypothetical protein [Ureaplasma miroungigenitalium]MCV3734014.1 hypothetical protein [Ureaplasma miroungigenitalium]
MKKLNLRELIQKKYPPVNFGYDAREVDKDFDNYIQALQDAYAEIEQLQKMQQQTMQTAIELQKYKDFVKEQDDFIDLISNYVNFDDNFNFFEKRPKLSCK